jgi:hypothetical protein
MKTTARSLLILLALTLFGAPLYAVETLKIPTDDVKVYATPNVNSPVIAVLKKGQTVTAGVNPGAGFKKVLVTDASGKKVVGYVTLLDLKPPIFPTDEGQNKDKKKKKKAPYISNGLGLRKHYAMGVLLGMNYMFQGGSTVSDPVGDTASAGGLSGINFEYGLLFDIPLNKVLTVETNLIYKSISLSGSGPSPSQNYNTIVNQENFLEILAMLKRYANEASDWWYGLGLSYDYGLSGSLQIGSQVNYSYKSSDIKGLYNVFLGTGYDFMSSKNFYFTPQFRLGAYPNGSPIIFEFAFLVAGTYRF